MRCTTTTPGGGLIVDSSAAFAEGKESARNLPRVVQRVPLWDASLFSCATLPRRASLVAGLQAHHALDVPPPVSFHNFTHRALNAN